MVHALWTESDIFADRDDLFSVALAAAVRRKVSAKVKSCDVRSAHRMPVIRVHQVPVKSLAAETT